MSPDINNINRTSTQESSTLTLLSGDIIAYDRIINPSSHIGIVFLHGYLSDKNGTKALYIEDFAKNNGLNFVRFDFFGHGSSSGDFLEATIGKWIDNALSVIDHLTSGPQIIVGSSMGGWVMLHTALRRKEIVKGLIGLAAAPDFTKDLISDVLKEEEKKLLEREGFYDIPCCDSGHTFRVTKKLLDEANNHLLLNKEIIDIDCPVSLIHGMKDEDVPYTYAAKLAEKLSSENVLVTLLKNSGHRLSGINDFKVIEQELKKLIYI